MRKIDGDLDRVALRATARALTAEAGSAVGGSRCRRPGVVGAARRVLAHLAGFAGVIVIAALPSHADDLQVRPLTIAVADFDYTDMSGEARDQQAEHAARLQAFAGAIRADLAGSGKYRVVTMTCAAAPCSAGRTRPATLLEDARRAGAKLLLYGGIQKMSTLIQYAKAQVVDVDADRLVLDRLITFRGDSDEAWQRAEQFLVSELVSRDGPR
ncbi:MAG TPA: DUF2380 domain-containing protein [Xanthobacteraceae bacterium]|nr:DUF2380 domain-containing protein [Xanthobacteraceae bacterium]